jgi:trk system potassium uptake protein TrkA
MGHRDFLVVGLGRFGQAVSQRLQERGHRVLGVESDLRIVQNVSSWITQSAQLDVTNIEALREIEAGEFDTAIVAIGSNFEASILATIFLKELGVRMVIAKALSTVHEHVLLRVGADEVIFPERQAGYMLGERLCK